MITFKKSLIALCIAGLSAPAFSSVADSKADSVPYGTYGHSGVMIDKLPEGSSDLSKEELFKRIDATFITKRHKDEYKDLSARDYLWKSTE